MEKLKAIIKNTSHSTGFIFASFVTICAYEITGYDWLRTIAALQFAAGFLILVIAMGIEDGLK